MADHPYPPPPRPASEGYIWNPQWPTKVKASKLQTAYSCHQYQNQQKCHLAKYGVLLIKPITPIQRYKELASVRVRRTSISTSNQASMIESQSRMEFISKCTAVYTLSTYNQYYNQLHSIKSLNLEHNPSRHQCSGQQQPQDMEGGLVTGAGAGGITALDEERLDDAMEDGAVVVALEAELDEVADGFGSFFGPKLDVDRPHRRLEHHLPLRRRFQGVHRRHGRSSRELRQTTAIPHLLFFFSSWLRCRIGVSFILGLSLFGSLGPKIKPNWLDFLSLGLLINLSCY